MSRPLIEVLAPFNDPPLRWRETMASATYTFKTLDNGNITVIATNERGIQTDLGADTLGSVPSGWESEDAARAELLSVLGTDEADDALRLFLAERDPDELRDEAEYAGRKHAELDAETGDPDPEFKIASNNLAAEATIICARHWAWNGEWTHANSYCADKRLTSACEKIALAAYEAGYRERAQEIDDERTEEDAQ